MKVRGQTTCHVILGKRSIWAFCLRMREMNWIIELGAICLNAYALRRVFKSVIYVARKILSREMKDYNKFTHISNTVDMHFVCRDFGWGYINDQSCEHKRDKGPKKWSLEFDLTKIKMFTGEDKRWRLVSRCWSSIVMNHAVVYWDDRQIRDPVW